MIISDNNIVHVYDFNYSQIVERFKDEIIKDYFQIHNPNLEPLDTNDILLPLTHPLREILAPKIESIIEENFYVGKKLGPTLLRVYVQNNQKSSSNLHSHHHLFGSIAGVFYYNTPKEGGEFFYRYLENNIIGEEQKIKIEENKLYLFPMWLPHTALPQKDEINRICFNITYPSNERPIHKETGMRW